MEPTAAALYYAVQSDEDLNGKYAIYDLGGGIILMFQLVI